MKCSKCGFKLTEVSGVTYGGKTAYYCYHCRNKEWKYKQE